MILFCRNLLLIFRLFLQFDGQRKIRGAISALEDLRVGSADTAFADFVFDQRLLKSGM